MPVLDIVTEGIDSDFRRGEESLGRPQKALRIVENAADGAIKSVSTPAAASAMAQTSPAGPPPTTTTSAVNVALAPFTLTASSKGY